MVHLREPQAGLHRSGRKREHALQVTDRSFPVSSLQQRLRERELNHGRVRAQIRALFKTAECPSKSPPSLNVRPRT